MSESLNAADAAKRMNISVQKVRDLCRRGILAGAFQERENGPWAIPSSVVDKWIEENLHLTQPSSLPSRVISNPSKTDIDKDTNFTTNKWWWQAWSKFIFKKYKVIISALVTLLTVAGILVAIGNDFGGAEKQLEEWGLIHTIPSAQENEFLVLVAEFKGSGGYDPTTHIYTTLSNAIEEAKLENVRIERVANIPQIDKDAITLASLLATKSVIT